MNDETHDSGPIDGPDGVLRPFTPPEQPPLPPVEPSKVVPAPPAVAEEPAPPEQAAPPEETAPVDTPVPPPPPPAALTDDPWSPDLESAIESEVDDAADSIGDETVETAAYDPGTRSEPALPLADRSPAGATVTLPRKPFLIGLGLLLAAVAVLAVLWQTSDDDADDATPIDGDEQVVDDPVAPDDSVPEPDPVDVDEPPVDDAAADALADARAEIAALEATVEVLEERPPPALDGTTLRRIVVGADAKFVSALPESVAVVGAFGGVSLIDPETNRVVANGNVADAATRILRTPTSVWLTDYSDNQLMRVDPVTNTVAETFSFEGPDGIDKDGDTIVVASFDGEFVARVDPESGEILQQVDVGGKPTAVISRPEQGLWAAVFDTGELVEIDRDSFEIVQRVSVGQGPVGISAGATLLWVTTHDEGTVAKVDPATGEVLLTVAVGNGPTESIVFAGSVWVTVTDDGALVELGGDGEIRSRTPLGGANAGGGPTGISFADGTMWVAMQGEQSVVRIDLE